jgi:hypothetical protein
MNNLSLYQASSRSILHLGSGGLAPVTLSAGPQNRGVHGDNVTRNQTPATNPVTFIELLCLFQVQDVRFSETTKIRLQNLPIVAHPPYIFVHIFSFLCLDILLPITVGGRSKA